MFRETPALDSMISIHSLVKRETFRFSAAYPRLIDFNPLPRKEGDNAQVANSVRFFYFNPLPRKEGDRTVGKV